MGIFNFLKNAATKASGTNDPVCGMGIDLGNAKFKTTYQDKEYGFCSENCQKEFEKNPSQYV